MDAVRIRGGNTLLGETKIQGSKNAVLPVLAATLLIGDISIIENCPRISDVFHMQTLLKQIGCKIRRADRTLMIDAREVSPEAMRGEAVKGMRSSIMLLGAMLGRFHEASMEYPGGCVIGKRPINMHLMALKKMGAVIEEKEEYFIARAKKLQGTVLSLEFPSVGATENIILAAVMANGITVLKNAAREPEIVTLCEFLTAAGARIEGIGGEALLIQGGYKLHGVRFKIPADRIVAGTYLLAAAGIGGHVFLRDAPVSQMGSVLKAARELGCEITISKEGVSVMTERRDLTLPYVKTEIYPGFPTDLQSPLIAVLSSRKGISIIEETIFENRFMMVGELLKMGANIQIEGRKAKICGVEHLKPASLCARELRGGAGLIIAAAMAEGESLVSGRHYIERGYEDICRDLQNLGINMVYE